MHACISPRAADGVVFGLGAGAYGLIEVLYKGDTHPTMLVAGGICFLAMQRISLRLPQIPFLGKCLMSGAAVTGVEFAFGCVFNLALKMNVWDYSHLPFNVAGQVCLWRGRSEPSGLTQGLRREAWKALSTRTRIRFWTL